MPKTRYSPWPSFTPEEADAVSRVLLSNRVNYWTGEETRSFEKEFASWVGAEYGIALGNGTLALEVAVRAFQPSPEDEVIVPPRTFIATASAVVTAGARPIFADVDRETQGLSAETIERAITPRTKGIIVVHLAGMACDMDPIMELARSRGLFVIEDCAQCHGGMYKGRHLGTIGDIGAWSFCQDKIMTTGGEGGMVTTDRRDLWSRMWSFKDHGKSWEAVYERQHAPGFRWLHESIGSNYRMLEMQAVIGRIQLRRMAEWTARRTSVASALEEALAAFSSIRMPKPTFDFVHAYYRVYAFVRPENLATGWTRDRIAAEINEAGAVCLHGTCSEIYLEKAFVDSPSRPVERLEVARELGDTSLAFLAHPTLTDEEVERMTSAIKSVLEKATR
ncbi:DegT/DnrJ/EryC1/StrS aminotransferase family protein [Pseudorhizobium halotolerans]|uniref:DegT/DnrJ/EryC1/StrS aminotransferase family protein n=1 Tax=Pseudorhizobium halotolerans TaxID=1233081 RepID=A0ABN7JVT1_9HYPH|nr:DegT/DnrJ/EryC1/StrS aminotransferase family protein [Pseudorhizobium halotolerans]CAD7050769.1 DegT/DnrJ/EryC1/StrS aminotransferase family protein [Pseudorhizobium halotolerans]